MEIGQDICNFAEENDSQFHVVVSSPYLRCVQTAAAICHNLGKGTRLIIDRSLGEVFGPSVMGKGAMPEPATRPFAELQQHCIDHGAHLDARFIGTWPEWPETLSEARHRYARRFLTYLRRGTKTNRNFVMVTHADCVGVALSLMPTEANTRVESVDYGGLFKAKRSPPGRRPGTASESGAATGKRLVAWDDVMPRSSTAPLEEVNQESEQLDDLTCLDEQAEPRSGSRSKDAELPRPDTGWQVETKKLNIRQRRGNQQGTAAKLAKRVKQITKNSRFTWKQVEELLGGGLTDQPLGMEHTGIDDLGRASPRHLSRMTDVSFSTCVFGEPSDHEGSIGYGTLTDLPEDAQSFCSANGPEAIDDHYSALDFKLRVVAPNSKLEQASTDHYLSRSGVRAATLKQRLGQKLGSVSGRNRGRAATASGKEKAEREGLTCDATSPTSPPRSPKSPGSGKRNSESRPLKKSIGPQLGEPKRPELKSLKESSLFARRIAKSRTMACPTIATSHSPSAPAEETPSSWTEQGPKTPELAATPELVTVAAPITIEGS
jgi:broad specificity phosphatase PhoE